MTKSILTPNQRKFLDFFSSKSVFTNEYYLGGGTALSEYYLQHRKSEDLDFFGLRDIEPILILPYIKMSKPIMKYKALDFQTSFNRNLFHLIFPNNQTLKIEFVYFPFEQIERSKVINNIKVDSLIDIAVNKIFTISQNPRGRDYFDIYFILKSQSDWTIDMLLKKAKIKFDWHVDAIQLGSQLKRVSELMDDPILEKQVSKLEIVNFINQEADRLIESSLK